MPFRLTVPKFRRTEKRLLDLQKKRFESILRTYGEMGISALSNATPKDTGEASASWSYSVSESNGVYRLAWGNSKMAGSTPLVILIQYGHGTRGGTFVPGIDFINPALKPVFDGLKRSLRAEVLR